MAKNICYFLILKKYKFGDAPRTYCIFEKKFCFKPCYGSQHIHSMIRNEYLNKINWKIYPVVMVSPFCKMLFCSAFLQKFSDILLLYVITNFKRLLLLFLSHPCSHAWHEHLYARIMGGHLIQLFHFTDKKNESQRESNFHIVITKS